MNFFLWAWLGLPKLDISGEREKEREKKKKNHQPTKPLVHYGCYRVFYLKNAWCYLQNGIITNPRSACVNYSWSRKW